jgi:putative ABC transport system substrate-binding protein
MRPVRLLLTTLLAVALASPAPGGELIIAVIKSRDIAPYNQAIRGFDDFLKARGLDPWLVPFDLERSGTTPEALLEEVRRKKPALIFTLGTRATEAAATQILDLPVVYGVLLNPGPAISRNRNVTGAMMDIPFETQFAILKSMLPAARSVAILHNPAETAAVVEEADRAAKGMGLRVVPLPVRGERELPGQVKDLRQKADILWMIADSTVYTPTSTEYLLQEMMKQGVPFVGLSGRYVKAGALFAISWDYNDMGAQAGEMAHRILGGVPPWEVPPVRPRTLPLEINLRSARSLGVRIPRAILDEAAQIHE